MEDVLDIALHVEEENTLEQALRVNIEVSRDANREDAKLPATANDPGGSSSIIILKGV